MDLPANVTFESNLDHFNLDQAKDVIESAQAFQEDNGDLTIELWGTTTVITPTGKRYEGQRFQQNAIIEFTGKREFTWRVTRIIVEPDYDVSVATSFQMYGTEDTVAKYRRV
jgi:hypothetical protein